MRQTFGGIISVSFFHKICINKVLKSIDVHCCCYFFGIFFWRNSLDCLLLVQNDWPNIESKSLRRNEEKPKKKKWCHLAGLITFFANMHKQPQHLRIRLMILYVPFVSVYRVLELTCRSTETLSSRTIES